MRISLTTLGCKLNQAETNEIADELKKLGFIIVPSGERADIAVIRACAVTQNASQATRGHIRRAKRGGAYVIAGGCLENRALPEIDFVALTPSDIIKKIMSLKPRFKAGVKSRERAAERTRSFIKIQDGCNFSCAYCVVPHYRGKSKSLPVKEILNKINRAQKDGCHEIVLTGVNICQYARGKLNLAGLIKKILSDTKIERIRLGSLDPRLVSDELINVYTNPRLMPHWHLSLQSGSDSVLERMRRGYTAEQYEKIVNKIRSLNPLFSMTTDIIAGFPGETEKEFMESLDFVKKIGFAKIHVFPYSPRAGTIAAEMTKAVQDKIKTGRAARLINAGDISACLYGSKLIGKVRPILFESVRNGRWSGYSPEYVPVILRTKKNLKNKIVPLKIKKEHLKTGV